MAKCPHDFTSGGTGIVTTCCACGVEMPSVESYAIGKAKLDAIYQAGLELTAPSSADCPACYYPLPCNCPIQQSRTLLPVTDEILARTREIIANHPVRAAGYRIKVLLLESDKGLAAGEAQIAPTLAASGFEMKSDKQKAREDKGTDTALIVDMGPACYCRKDYYGDEKWVKVGHVIKMIRYTGHAYEEPPGSGKRYALISDEDILGFYDRGVNDE